MTSKNLRLYEAVAHEVAMDAADRRELTDEERVVSRRVLATARGWLETSDREARNVRASIRAMERPSLLQRFVDIFVTHPRALAFRDLDRLTDEDLRSALEDAESMLERMV